jgi:hypothetical protein
LLLNHELGVYSPEKENEMSKSLRSMSESERKAAIARRLSSNTKGLGYWAAVDAQARLTKRAADLLRAAVSESKVKTATSG